MVEHAILAADDELVAAQLRGDVAALDRLLDDELHFIGLDGRVHTKDDDLAAHRSGTLRVIRMKVLERRVMDLGDVVVVSVLADSAAEVAGRRHEAPLRYTRIWRRQPEGWKIVAGHMSAVQAE